MRFKIKKKNAREVGIEFPFLPVSHCVVSVQRQLRDAEVAVMRNHWI